MTDTTEFMAIDYGDVIALGGRHYLVLRDEVERRFGLEDPKYWVKRCRELETGERKILKLAFYEQFPLQLGEFKILCHRSPEKEARILTLVRDDWRFMQGVPVFDSKRNVVRVIDLIRGKRIDDVVDDIDVDHRTYFFQYLPDILKGFIGAAEAIGALHTRWEKHGDIRRDHLWVEHETGRYRWIDFDYAFDFQENPFGLDIFGLGNILLFLVGKGEHTRQTLEQGCFPEAVVASLTNDDYALMYGNRLANLGKLFPYIPIRLNRVLMHFSSATDVFYEYVDELLDDLRPALNDILEMAQH